MPRGQVVRRKTVTFADDRSRSSNGQVGVVSMKKYKNLKRKLEESLEVNANYQIDFSYALPDDRTICS